MDVTNSLDLPKVRIDSLPADCSLRYFNCGEQEIDWWARNKAEDHHKQNRTKVFGAFEPESSTCLGFYGLSFSTAAPEYLTGQYRDIYKTTGSIPLIYIPCLAVLRNCQGCGLGKLLLGNALHRAYTVSQHVAFYGVALTSLNERTTKFYEAHGFGRKEAKGHAPLMILPVWTLQDLFGKGHSSAQPQST